jgi:hypothetical protein
VDVGIEAPAHLLGELRRRGLEFSPAGHALAASVQQDFPRLDRLDAQHLH